MSNFRRVGGNPSSIKVLLIALAFLWLNAGCAITSVFNSESKAATAEEKSGEAVEARAVEILMEAQETEPEVTPLLKRFAEAVNGEFWGFEHRFKQKHSMIRKIKKSLVENPKMAADDVEITDALRYTLLIDDDPPGTHVSTINKVLKALEDQDHDVELVKNYWPTGDNYSGVNCVLEAPSGLLWELQFHTHASKENTGDNRLKYEELRSTETPVERKQELFDEMSTSWEEIPIPQEMLTPKSLHDSEEIITRPRP